MNTRYETTLAHALADEGGALCDDLACLACVLFTASRTGDGLPRPGAPVGLLGVMSVPPVVVAFVIRLVVRGRDRCGEQFGQVDWGRHPGGTP